LENQQKIRPSSKGQFRLGTWYLCGADLIELGRAGKSRVLAVRGLLRLAPDDARDVSSDSSVLASPGFAADDPKISAYLVHLVLVGDEMAAGLGALFAEKFPEVPSLAATHEDFQFSKNDAEAEGRRRGSTEVAGPAWHWRLSKLLQAGAPVPLIRLGQPGLASCLR
jgi:hypothetical protein